MRRRNRCERKTATDSGTRRSSYAFVEKLRHTHEKWHAFHIMRKKRIYITVKLHFKVFFSAYWNLLRSVIFIELCHIIQCLECTTHTTLHPYMVVMTSFFVSKGRCVLVSVVVCYALSKVRRCLRHNLCSQPYGSKSLVRSTGSAVWNF
jgi:hypothetical protein